MLNRTSRDSSQHGGGTSGRSFTFVTTQPFPPLLTDLVADACFTFARRDFHGRLRTADEVHAMSLANLNNEYCTVLDTAAVLAGG